MKNYIFIVLLLIYTPTMANMANPILEGTLGSRPFVNQYVDVVHEDLYIKLDDKFEFARFEIKYHINSSTNGIKIPFLFYASEYLDSFIVKIDDHPITIQTIPYEYQEANRIKFQDFTYFFNKAEYNAKSDVSISDSENGGFIVTLDNMLYFETDISKGKHTIEVSYRATKWTNTWDWINEYSFRYALSPAKYWKSFGTLDLTIDATAFNKNLNTNIGNPKSGNINAIAFWHFDSIPTDVVIINYKPECSKIAHFLIKIGPSTLAYITGFILLLIHFIATRWYRKHNPLKKYSLVVITGSILIPFIICISWIYYYDFIDYFIGEHASKRHGYTFLTIFLYPIILPLYWLLFWFIDKRIKKNFPIEV